MESPILDKHLHSHCLGAYKNNLALIVLDRDTSFWSAANDPTLYRWCVFAHEYAHFLHNFSTVSGLYDFLAHLRLEGLFLRTVDAQGRSHGSDVLTADEKADFKVWLALKRHLSGDIKTPFDEDYHRGEVAIEIVDIARSQTSLVLSTQPFPLDVESVLVSMEVSSQTTERSKCSATFGAWHIREALAYEIEKAIQVANGAEATAQDSAVPSYPYRFGRILFEFIARAVVDSKVFNRICLMALQSTDPGAAFIDIAREYRTRRVGEADDVTLRRLEDITLRTSQESAQNFIHRTLQPEFDRFIARGGHVGKAVATLGTMCLNYADLRSRDLFFELKLFEQPLNRDTLRNLIQSYPPCPIVHETGLGGAREFISLSAKEIPQEEIDALCVFQAFSQFMFAHIREDGFNQPSENALRRCIFFGACVANQAVERPEFCGTKPWMAFAPDNVDLCTYGAAVSESRARADL
jgi:hypothetical protein